MARISLLLLLAVSCALVAQVDQRSQEQPFQVALSVTDPTKKIQSLEGFLRDFPDSAHKAEALDTLISLYYRAGDIGQLESTARRLLKVDPSSERAIRAIKYVGARNYQQGFNPDDIRSSVDQTVGTGERAELLKAISTTDDTAKAPALEAYLASHPASPFSETALTQLLAVYQSTKNMEGTLSAAERLLKVNEDNVFGLAAIVSVFATRGEKGGNKEADNAQVLEYAQRGQRAMKTFTRPPNLPQNEFEGVRRQLTQLFNDAGLTALMRSTNWTATKIEVISSRQEAPQSTGVGLPRVENVFVYTIVAGQHETLHCTYDCASLQPGLYDAEVKKGEIKVHGSNLKNGKQKIATFRISGTW